MKSSPQNHTVIKAVKNHQDPQLCFNIVTSLRSEGD